MRVPKLISNAMLNESLKKLAEETQSEKPVRPDRDLNDSTFSEDNRSRKDEESQVDILNVSSASEYPDSIQDHLNFLRQGLHSSGHPLGYPISSSHPNLTDAGTQWIEAISLTTSNQDSITITSTHIRPLGTCETEADLLEESKNPKHPNLFHSATPEDYNLRIHTEQSQRHSTYFQGSISIPPTARPQLSQSQPLQVSVASKKSSGSLIIIPIGLLAVSFGLYQLKKRKII